MQFPPPNPKSCAKTQVFHEVEVCRRKEVSEAKVTPFFDNCAVFIRKVPARERLVDIDIRPSVNSFKKMKRVVRLETSVCFCITMLMNNQIKNRKKSHFPKRRECDDKNAVAVTKSVSQLVCVSDALVSQNRKSRRNPMQIVLEPIQRVRFTKSNASLSEYPGKERTIVGKINVKVPHQRSPYAMKF